MSETPKKIWMDAYSAKYDWNETSSSEDIPYIREDIVLKLVEALNLTMPTLERLMFEAKGSYGKNFTPRCETDIRNYEIVRAALKALESAEIGRGME
jgi:hypothetical protein